MEAKAIGVALQFARDVGISDFIMEGDSLVVHNALCGHLSPPSSMASVISGELVFCGLFRRVDFSHIRRQGNKPTFIGKTCYMHCRLCIMDGRDALLLNASSYP